MVKKTQEDFEERLNEKFPHIQIRGKYTGINNPIECICDLDDYNWSPRAYNVLKNGCPCCNGNRITLKSFKNELENTHPEVNVITDGLGVVDYHTKLDCVCKVCGLEFNKELIAIRKWGCSRCNTNYHNSRGLTQEEYCKRIYDLYGDDITVLGTYKRTGTKLLHRCNIHNYEWETLPKTLLSGINSCKYCSGRMRSNGKRASLDDLKEKIKMTYGDEYEVLDDEYVDSKQKMRFMHRPKGDKPHIVISSPSRILHTKTGCPVCSGMQISKGYNDIATTDKEIAVLFLNEEDTYKYGRCSNVKADFKCPTCGCVVHKSINQVSKDREIRCPICKDGISYPNKFIFNILLQIEDKLDFLKREYCPKWCRFEYQGKKRKGIYDIYFGINGKKYLIEMDGGLHFKYNNMNGQTVEDSKFIDSEKDRLALENGTQLIRINCNYKGFEDRYEYVRDNILSSVLGTILPISLVDFDNANVKSQTSLFLETCRLWNEGYKVQEIIDELKITKCLASSYLNTGNKYGLCKNYSPIESNHRSNGIKVICVNTKEIFDTVLDASKHYNIDGSGIKDCCDNSVFSAGKHKETKDRLFWMYYEDYIKMTPEDIENYYKEKQKFADENNIYGRKVVCLTTKIGFLSVMSAARHYKICETGIRKCCKGEIETSGKLEDGTRLKWMYYDDFIKEYDESTLVNQGCFLLCA